MIEGNQNRPDQEAIDFTAHPEGTTGEIVPFKGFAVSATGETTPIRVQETRHEKTDTPTSTDDAPDQSAPRNIFNRHATSRRLSERELRDARIAGHTVETPPGTRAHVEVHFQDNPTPFETTTELTGRYDVRTGGNGTFALDHPGLRYLKKLADEGNPDAARILAENLDAARQELAHRMVTGEPELRERIEETGEDPENVVDIKLSRLKGMRVSFDEKYRLRQRDGLPRIIAIENDMTEREEAARSRAPRPQAAPSDADWYDDVYADWEGKIALPEGEGRILGRSPLRSIDRFFRNELE